MSEEVTRPPVIDAWVQPWTQEVSEGIQSEGIWHVFEQYGQADRLRPGVPITEMNAEMDEAGVSHAILSAGPFMTNRLVADIAASHPDRYSPMAWVDPTVSIRSAVAELQRRVVDDGFIGLKVEPFLHDRPPTDAIFYPLYSKCVELDIAVQIQVGNTGPMLPSYTGDPLYIDRIALDFPELRIVCGHIGWPWTEVMIAVAWKHPNVFVDTSAYLPKSYPDAFVKFMKTFGQDRCIYASDWPLLPFGRPLRQVDEYLDLPPEARQKFLHDNACRAFKLELPDA